MLVSSSKAEILISSFFGDGFEGYIGEDVGEKGRRGEEEKGTI
jgi:hypothetical protein